MSIEHRYLPERLVGETRETRQAPKLVLDHRDADKIEAAWRKVSERRLQQILRLHYIWKAPPSFICRRLAIKQARDDRHYVLELGKAHRAIWSLLQPSRLQDDYQHVESLDECGYA